LALTLERMLTCISQIMKALRNSNELLIFLNFVNIDSRISTKSETEEFPLVIIQRSVVLSYYKKKGTMLS
jgi:hypothetical protein